MDVASGAGHGLKVGRGDPLQTPLLYYSIAVLLIYAGLLSAADRPKGYFSRLEELRNGIQEISATKYVTVEDRRSDGKSRLMHLDIAFHYSRQTGKASIRFLRVDGLPNPGKAKRNAGNTPSVPKAGDEITIDQAVPEPEWLLALDRNSDRWRIRAVKEKDGLLLEMRQLGRETGKPGKTILLNGDRLPVRIRTFGVKGKVLDDVAVDWGTPNTVPFPSKITITQYSRRNTLITTIVYSGTRIRSRSQAGSADTQ